MKKYLTVAAITLICCLINLSVFARQITIKLRGGESKYTFSTTDLKPAVYFYELRSNGALIAHGKLVIVR